MTTELSGAGIPLPIVRFNRITIVVTIILAFVTQQWWITTLLLLVLLAAIVFGPAGSLIFRVGKRLFPNQIASAVRRGETEDRRLMRFNNSIAVLMVALANGAFVANWDVAGWVLTGIVAAAATIALLGFCVGCFVYYRLRLAQYRLFGA